MAAGRHNLTRRALLGAAFAAPAVLGDCTAATAARRADRGRWERAYAGERRAKAALEAFRAQEMAAADRAYEAVCDRWPPGRDRDRPARATLRAAFRDYSRWEERLGDLGCAHLAAITRMLRTPAPDLPALAMKIELAADYQVWELDDGDRCLAVLKADGWRLASAGN